MVIEAPAWLALAAIQPIEAIRGFAAWWYARDMQPYSSGATAIEPSRDPHTLLGWYDELAFSYHHLFATDERSRVDFDKVTYQPVYIDNQGQWRLACDRHGGVWMYDGNNPDKGWQAQAASLAHCLVQTSLLEGVMSGNEFISANALPASAVAPLLAQLTELPLPVWTVAAARFYLGPQAIVMTQSNGGLLDVNIGALDPAALAQVCDGFDLSKFA